MVPGRNLQKNNKTPNVLINDNGLTQKHPHILYIKYMLRYIYAIYGARAQLRAQR